MTESVPIPDPLPDTSVANAVDALQVFAGGEIRRSTAELLIHHWINYSELSPAEITATLRRFAVDAEDLIRQATETAHERERWISPPDEAGVPHPGDRVMQYPGGAE
jgi:hypothetical protein